MTPTPMNQHCFEILNGLTTAVIWIDEHENIQYINVPAAELLQLSPSRVQGLNWRYILPKLISDIRECGTGRLTLHEYEIHLPDSQSVHATCTISYYDILGEEGWLIELYNTERHHRIAEEEDRWNQYEAGNLLVRTLAHEVKNPLAGIYGATQLLQRRFSQDEKAEKYTAIIASEVKRLQALVDRMLGPNIASELSQQAKHNIHELIDYVLQIIAGEKPDNIYVKLDFDPSIPEISMDFDAMVQALLNIVKNAVQAMTKQGGLITMRTRVEYKYTLGTKTYPLVAVMSVIDQGEGIPSEVFDSIFYPMVTSKTDGSGLGLPVAQNILRQHGGLIVVESKPGRTAFNLYLPFDYNRRSSTKKNKNKER